MHGHDFIIKPGIWVGEGRMVFTSSPEQIKYYTKWTVSPAIEKQVNVRQQVEMQGVEEHVNNALIFTLINDTSFVIQIENELFGNVIGKGIIGPKTIAWEFRGTGAFEGLEVYELQESGDYMVHGEYTSTDQHRTIVDGRIWKKTSPP